MEARLLPVTGREPTIFELAEEAVNGKRREQYGPAEMNHQRTAILWQAYTEARRLSPKAGTPEDAEDVCWRNILQKISRELNSPTQDGLVDAVGYAENIEQVRNARMGQEWFRRTIREYYERANRA
jgi:hypothetical protein